MLPPSFSHLHYFTPLLLFITAQNETHLGEPTRGNTFHHL